MRLRRRGLERTLDGDSGPIEIRRDGAGVPHIHGATTTDALRGLGFCHGFDRGLQMALGRIIGSGRAAATLEASDPLVALDTLFLRLDLARGASIQIERLAPRNRERLQAYCDGVNQAFAERTPWELRLVRHRPPPWQPTDASC